MNEKLSKRIYRNKRQQAAELKLLYQRLLEGYSHDQTMSMLGLKRSNYFRYLKMLKAEADTEFQNKANNANSELGLSAAMLHDRLSGLYNLCLQRLNDSNKNKDKEFSEITKIMQELAINVFRLDSQGVNAAINIARQTSSILDKTNTEPKLGVSHSKGCTPEKCSTDCIYYSSNSG